MLGTIVNAAAILAGGLLGLLLKKGLPEKMADTLMKALGLCTLYIGIRGCFAGENTLVLIVSMVIGTIIGEGLDLDDKMNRFGKWIEKKLVGDGQDGEPELVRAGQDGAPELVRAGRDGEPEFAGGGSKPVKTGTKVSVSEGFVTASLLFCVGAMAVVGSLQSGLLGQHETLFAKSTLDFTAAIIFASSLGVGVLLSAGSVFVYQGAITVLAGVLKPLLNDAVIAEMNCTGNVIIIGLALNLLGVTKLKVMNFVPAILLPILLCRFL